MFTSAAGYSRSGSGGLKRERSHLPTSSLPKEYAGRGISAFMANVAVVVIMVRAWLADIASGNEPTTVAGCAASVMTTSIRRSRVAGAHDQKLVLRSQRIAHHQCTLSRSTAVGVRSQAIAKSRFEQADFITNLIPPSGTRCRARARISSCSPDAS
jgi:hypothetical protein